MKPSNDLVPVSILLPLDPPDSTKEITPVKPLFVRFGNVVLPFPLARRSSRLPGPERLVTFNDLFVPFINTESVPPLIIMFPEKSVRLPSRLAVKFEAPCLTIVPVPEMALAIVLGCGVMSPPNVSEPFVSMAIAPVPSEPLVRNLISPLVIVVPPV